MQNNSHILETGNDPKSSVFNGLIFSAGLWVNVLSNIPPLEGRNTKWGSPHFCGKSWSIAGVKEWSLYFTPHDVWELWSFTECGWISVLTLSANIQCHHSQHVLMFNRNVTVSVFGHRSQLLAISGHLRSDSVCGLFAVLFLSNCPPKCK